MATPLVFPGLPEVLVGKWLLAAFSASDPLPEVLPLWDRIVVDGIQATWRVGRPADAVAWDC